MLKEMTLEYVESLKYVDEIPRRFALPEAGSDIVAVVGPRRVGKTFTLLKKAAETLKAGGQVVYATFDNPELRKWSAKKLAEEVRSLYPTGRVALFLDEVQEWPNWDYSLRWLHDVKDFQIYATGSTSALSVDQVPSRLRGRYISKLLLPLSFAELAHGAAPHTFRERGALKSLLDDYLKWGGFPEVWKSRSLDKVRALLDTVFYRDVVEARGVREPEEFEALFYTVVENYANPATWRSLARALASEGVEIDPKTVIKYVKYMQWAYLIFVVPPYGRRRGAPRKIYLVDPAFTNLTKAGLDKGRKIENVTYLHLLRKALEEGGKIYYIKDREEVDFYYVGQERAVVEAAYDPDESHIRKAAKAAEKLGLKRAHVVTWDTEDTRRVGQVDIEIIPLWKWLLR